MRLLVESHNVLGSFLKKAHSLRVPLLSKGKFVGRGQLEIGFEESGRFPGEGGCRHGPRSQKNVGCLCRKCQSTL